MILPSRSKRSKWPVCYKAVVFTWIVFRSCNNSNKICATAFLLSRPVCNAESDLKIWPQVKGITWTDHSVMLRINQLVLPAILFADRLTLLFINLFIHLFTNHSKGLMCNICGMRQHAAFIQPLSHEFWQITYCIWRHGDDIQRKWSSFRKLF